MNNLLYLPQVDSTNTYAKQHYADFDVIGTVYTTNQTAGRGRLGRTWVNAAGQALYLTVVIKTPLAQPSTLPLLASLSVREVLRRRYGVNCQIKWPNDLLLNGKKLVGILCESIQQADGERGILCGVGINLAQPQEYFNAANLPYATSLALEGVHIDPETDPEWLAQQLTDFGFDRELYTFGPEGFAPYRAKYREACVNIGRPVTFDGGVGTATDVDEQGQLVVTTGSGEQRVFTGEVSVQGVYGNV